MFFDIRFFIFHHLNLPSVITYTSGNSIEFVYDAAGMKLRKIVKVGATVQYEQSYLGGLEYRKNGTGSTRIEAVYHNEGRYLNLNAEVNNTLLWQKEYTIKDHLGNARISFTDKNANGIVDVPSDIVQENHYYPFGLNYEGGWRMNDAARDNKYQYNSKEWNDDFGLNWNDYGARWYDAVIGRFPSIDRFSEKYSSVTPYQYGANNPVLNIDVNGDYIQISFKTGFLGLGGKQTVFYNNGNLQDAQGNAYTGKVKGFLKQSKHALDAISNVSSGKSLLTKLTNSKFTFNIERGSNRFEANSVPRSQLARVAPNAAAQAGSGGTVYFNPSSTTSGANQLGNTTRPSFIGLAHELGHASMSEQGMSDLSPFNATHPDPELARVTNDEFNAAHTENQIRSEYNLPLREWYTNDSSGAGFMRFLVPGTTSNNNGYDYRVRNPMIINYTGKNSGR